MYEILDSNLGSGTPPTSVDKLLVRTITLPVQYQ